MGTFTKIIIFLLFLSTSGIAQVSYNMTLFSNLDLPDLPSRFGAEYNDCWGFRHANGTEIAIVGGIEDIFFINVTAPAAPVVIHTHHVLNANSTVNQSLWRDFKSYENYVYAAADEGNSGLLVFDLSNVPASVTMVNQTQTFWSRSHNIYIDEEHGRLYGAGTNTVSNGLVILNIDTDPANPTLVQNIPLNGSGGGYVHDVFVRDNIAYCSHGSLSKLQMYDFSNLPTFTVVGTVANYPFPGYNHSSWLNSAGNLLVMADETHGSKLKLVDVTDPLNISNDDFETFYSELLGPGAPGSSIAHNPFILGDLVYVSYYHDGVQVFNISDPSDITTLAWYDTYPDNTGYNGYDGCWGVYPFLASGIIIASDQNNGLFVMEITDMTLDIEFLSFHAFRKNADVQLTWSVADATLGNRFEVRRSADGGVTYQTIGMVKFEDLKSNYKFLDEHAEASTRYVYRIDYVQLDDRKISSPIRYVRTESGEVTIRAINPIGTTLMLDILEPVELLDLKLFNMEGQLVWHRTEVESRARLEFDIHDLARGQYVLAAHWRGGSENLIIQKIN